MKSKEAPTVDEMQDGGIVLPNSLEVEQLILGAILFKSDCISILSEILTSDDFYRGNHGFIFSAAIDLFRRNEPIDIVSVAEMLNDKDLLGFAGGRPYLMELADSVATTENVTYYAEKLRQYSIRRRLITAGYDIIASAHSEDSEKALEQAESAIMNIAKQADTGRDSTTAEQLAEAMILLEQEMTSPEGITGLSTGFPTIDKILGGLNPSKLIILGGRPSMGKSALALNIALNVAMETGKLALYYSGEMEPAQLQTRAIRSVAESKSGELGQHREAVRKIPPHLRILDRPSLSPMQLRASMIRERMTHGEIGVVIVDYLQLMTGKGTDLRHQVSYLSRELKMIANEFRVPLIALSQLSRNCEARQDKRPMLSDLRESGTIEQDADAVLFAYRDEYYNKETDRPSVAEIIIAKQRGGATGTVELIFRPDIMRFYDPLIRRSVF